jgi:hypothetical protein
MIVKKHIRLTRKERVQIETLLNVKKSKSSLVYYVLAPIKEEYYSKFRLLIIRLIYSLKLGIYPVSIFPLV